jgi:hypothetical protein
MPILGIMASQISGHLWAPEGAYDSLATVTLSANTSSITFAGIPAGYKHLQLRATWANSTGADTWMRINGDTGSNYAAHYLNGNGSAAAGGAITGAGALGAYLGYSGSTTAFTGAVMDILDYTSTAKNKTTRSLTGYDANGSGQIYLFSSLYFATPAAVTSLTITPASGNLTTNSSFALYGIK